MGVRRTEFSSFWHGGELPPHCRACLKSFIDHGHSFTRVPLPTGANGKPATGPFANWVSAVVVKPGAPSEFTAAVGFFLDNRLASRLL